MAQKNGMKHLMIRMGVLFALCMAMAGMAADPVSKGTVLRHVVSIKFKPGTTAEQIKTVEDAFRDLKNKISQISSLEWGVNNSEEGRTKGFTHCFILGFKSEADRAAYLPHPAHKAFGKVLVPVMDDVMVIDFWARE